MPRDELGFLNVLLECQRSVGGVDRLLFLILYLKWFIIIWSWIAPRKQVHCESGCICAISDAILEGAVLLTQHIYFCDRFCNCQFLLDELIDTH
jgi:hypothetical protein